MFLRAQPVGYLIPELGKFVRELDASKAEQDAAAEAAFAVKTVVVVASNGL